MERKVKIVIPPPQSQYAPPIAPIISSIFWTFPPDNLKITLDYRSKKSKKCFVLWQQFEEKLFFWHFLLQIVP